MKLKYIFRKYALMNWVKRLKLLKSAGPETRARAFLSPMKLALPMRVHLTAQGKKNSFPLLKYNFPREQLALARAAGEVFHLCTLASGPSSSQEERLPIVKLVFWVRLPKIWPK